MFGILRENNPELTGEKRRTIMKPPQVRAWWYFQGLCAKSLIKCFWYLLFVVTWLHVKPGVLSTMWSACSFVLFLSCACHPLYVCSALLRFCSVVICLSRGVSNTTQAGVLPVFHKQSHNLHRQARRAWCTNRAAIEQGKLGRAAPKLVADRCMREVWPHRLVLQYFVFHTW